jgi:hypothetical protein
MLKALNVGMMLAAHPVMAAAAERAREREETICRLTVLVGDRAEAQRAEAQRAVELAERVGLGASAVYNIAARGEPLPKTEEELLATSEAGQRRVEDLARILGVR